MQTVKKIILFVLFSISLFVFIYVIINGTLFVKLSSHSNSMFKSNTLVSNFTKDYVYYPIVSNLSVYYRPSFNSNIKLIVSYRTVFKLINRENNFGEIKLTNGLTGFVPLAEISNISIDIVKKERLLILKQGDKNIKSWKIALGFNPLGDKQQEGDGKTPLGLFYISKYDKKPTKKRYGARSLFLSYPSSEDAKRGLKNALISKRQYDKIISATAKGKTPPQKTVLGSSIRIHGGGNQKDWTAGCIGMSNKHIIELYNLIPKSMARVMIFKSKRHANKLNSFVFINSRISAASKFLMKKGCDYTNYAVRYRKLSFPFGDINKKHGVCSDLVIRALRYIHIDLQALMNDDITHNSKWYTYAKRPNYNIDHRRVRNLIDYFYYNTQKLPNEYSEKTKQFWMPGDIIFFDTGVRNGTKFDHIGVVSSKIKHGRLQVYNLWTVGYSLNEMDLLSGQMAKVVGHYRLLHPYFYDGMVD